MQQSNMEAALRFEACEEDREVKIDMLYLLLRAHLLIAISSYKNLWNNLSQD